MNTHWHEVVHDVHSGVPQEDLLSHLKDNTAAVIVLKNTLQPDTLRGLVNEIAARREQATVSAYSNGSLTTFGSYLARHLARPSAYFNAVENGSGIFRSQTEDLRETVRSVLLRNLRLQSLTVAMEPDGRSYAPAVVRVHSSGVGNPLHNDNIMRDAAGTGLYLANLSRQFSCITCIQECDADGELLHYRRRWRPEHERFKVQGGLGYHDGVIAGAEVCRFRPATGDIYLIDPTNFHAIQPVFGKDRITLGFFFGFFNDDCVDGVCWS